MATPQQEFSTLPEVTQYTDVNDTDILLLQTAAKVPKKIEKSNLLSCNQVLCAELTITHAQILLLNTTPQQIVPAPGAGKAVWATSAYVIEDYTGGVAYATNLGILLQNTGAREQMKSTSLGYTVNRIANFGHIATPTAAQNQIIENTDLEVSVANGDPTGGAAGNFITVVVYYYLINL